MTIKDDVWQVLTADADVGSLVSNSDSPQTYRVFRRPQPYKVTAPYIVLTIVFGEHLATFSGRTTLKHTLMQIDVYAATEPAARTLADHVYDAMDSGVSVTAMNEVELFEDDIELSRIMLEFTIWQ